MFKLSFKTDNAAFDDYKTGEVYRILKELALAFECSTAIKASGTIRDVNGNSIGFYKLT